MTSTQLDIDPLDRKILAALQRDGRIPFVELARKFHVASGTIHLRVEKLKEMGIIQGSKILISAKALGHNVCCFIGINLKSANDYKIVLANLKMFDEVVEAYYTTGNHSLFIKVMTKSIDELHIFLITKLQNIKEIRSTETLMVLDNPIQRDIRP